MGLMDKSVTKEEFDNFSIEVLREIGVLKNNSRYKSSDRKDRIIQIEKEAITASKELKETEIIIKNNLSDIQEYKDKSEKILDGLNKAKSTLTIEINTIKEQQGLIVDKTDEITASSLRVNANIQVINDALDTVETLPGDVENIKNLIEASKDTSKEIEALKKHSMDKKSEIDKIHNEIYGQEIEDEHIDGTKDKLEKTYNHLKGQIEKLDNLLSKSIEEAVSEFNDLLESSQNSYEEVGGRLKTLLPGAMASGLSSAYTNKINDEKTSQKELGNNFKYSLLGLIIVSSIPIIIDIYRLIWSEALLLEVIKDTPILIISMLPIYFPILWFAHSSSKKLNLSKRLIEEYTHKAVLGNTFEGLSTQIESLSVNDNIRDELRVKLLFNLLQVSSENPGKLITDYQTSDHPLMEALENSIKLSSSIDRLNKIPGFSAIAKKLSTKRDSNINKVCEDAENGLNQQDNINKNTNE